MKSQQHRRITAVIEYRPPDASMRRLIWNNLLSQSISKTNKITAEPSVEITSTTAPPQIAAVRLASDVDVSAIAAKYELTGGFIKNAVLSALLTALGRDKTNPVLQQVPCDAHLAYLVNNNLSLVRFSLWMQTADARQLVAEVI